MSTIVYSLTEHGLDLAQRLKDVIPGLVLKHKPENFIKTVQQDFTAGNQGIFICSTGIVIRALAPVLVNKHSDPAVVVIDEHGKFAIPLLSGHEGGSAQLARSIADQLGAHFVSTSATDYGKPVYVLGMGCDRGCPQIELTNLLEVARSTMPLFLQNSELQFAALASIDLKSDEPGLIDLSNSLSIPFKTYHSEKLRSVEGQLSVKSDIVFKEVGCYGVAEAAALVAASEISGIESELIVTKQKNKHATLAIARSYIQ